MGNFIKTSFEKTQKFFGSLNYSKGLLRLWLLLTGIYVLVAGAAYTKHAYENYEVIGVFEELENNSTDFYMFAPTFFLWNGNPENDCITLGENFKKALEKNDIQTEPTENKVWINQGNTKLKREANFLRYKQHRESRQKLLDDLGIKPWERYKNQAQPTENNAALKEKYYAQFSNGWGNCASLYNQSLYRSFWKNVFQEGLIVLSIPLIVFAAGAFLIRFGHFILWPFSQAGKGLKFVLRWIAQGFKGN